ncbi:dihydrolipoamide acetyltransferase family protein [Microbaculum marinisediminis]|uniref:Dihydrolipoamide acetyltransferase component of pyruvate dehydrogenase complex n=1 Tax=Microbaculum marinisediminis TaxID=2931392 RepID=A0AAW5R6S5_9HYPH|nr:dihydrolipoamide acetyltransferase family protein [Microbaculum sp. A6E488]MCT8974819.1 2-oxo acid dehydrogenase subunit E2 [Microbaculum sp. A6E488]
MKTFNLPDLGEGLQEAEIVTWHVHEGDHVVAEQPLVSVETEKAVVEIPSPRSGHIEKLRAEEGAIVAVGAPLVDFAEGPRADTGAVVGELEEAAPETPKPPAAKPPAAPPGQVRAAPAVRAAARERGIDLSTLTGTGPDGAITLADLGPSQTGAPLRGARRAMALNMARAWAEVAHATIQDAVDIDPWPATPDVTGRMIRALATACRAEPSLNSRFDPRGPSLQPMETVDIGIAIDSPDGLFVPVLRDAARLSTADIREKIEAFKDGVARRTLPPDAFRDPTITLSNFGTIAGHHAALIVMPPQVAILGVGRMVTRPVRALPLSLSFDHRAVTGGEAARFLRAVMDDLEKPT